MPLVSVGEKGPPGPSEQSGWWCTKCSKVLSRKSALARHNLKVHGWCIKTNTKVTPEMQEAFKKKKPSKLAQRPEQPSSPEETSATARSTTETDVIGLISDDSSSGEEEDSAGDPVEEKVAEGPTTVQDNDVEPMDVPTLNSSSAPEKVVQKGGEVSLSGKKKVALKWTDAPQPVSETPNPCIRKRLEMSKPSAPVKHHLQARGMVVATGGSLSAEAPKEKEIERLFPVAASLPNRGARPSVRDIVAFRNTMPLDASPKEIGQVAKRRFHWTGNSTVPSEEYVQGVIAAYDFARKELLGELHEHLAAPPATAEVAMQRWD